LKQDEKFEQVDELELGTDDAPMSIAPYLDVGCLWIGVWEAELICLIERGVRLWNK